MCPTASRKLGLITQPFKRNAEKETYSSLQELEGTLILGNLQQFHDSLFIGSMTSDFLDDVTDELGVLGEFLQI